MVDNINNRTTATGRNVVSRLGGSSLCSRVVVVDSFCQSMFAVVNRTKNTRSPASREQNENNSFTIPEHSRRVNGYAVSSGWCCSQMKWFAEGEYTYVTIAASVFSVSVFQRACSTLYIQTKKSKILCESGSIENDFCSFVSLTSSRFRNYKRTSTPTFNCHRLWLQSNLY